MYCCLLLQYTAARTGAWSETTIHVIFDSSYCVGLSSYLTYVLLSAACGSDFLHSHGVLCGIASGLGHLPCQLHQVGLPHMGNNLLSSCMLVLLDSVFLLIWPAPGDRPL